MKSNIPERPTDPELANIHDTWVEIQNKNENVKMISSSAWLFYIAGIVAIFIPTTERAGWLLLLFGMVLLLTSIAYDRSGNKLRRELYEKLARHSRQSALGIIDQLKAALPDHEVTIERSGNISIKKKDEE